MLSPRFSLTIVHTTAFKLEGAQAHRFLMIGPVGLVPVEEAMGIVPVESHTTLAIDLAVRPVVAMNLIGAGPDQSRIGLEEAMMQMRVLIVTVSQPVGLKTEESNADGVILGAVQHG